MNKKIPIPLAILIIVLVIAAIVGIAILTCPEIPKSNTYVQTQDETADWQTYENKEYGFEMKYHKDWDFYEYLGIRGRWNEVYFPISDIYSNNCHLSFSYLTDEYSMINNLAVKEYGCLEKDTIINQTNAKKIECNDKSNAGFYNGYYIPIPNSNLFLRVFPWDAKDFDLKPGEPIPEDFIECNNFNQMLSTFRFIDKKTMEKRDLPIEITTHSEFKKYFSELSGANPELKLGNFLWEEKEIKVFRSSSLNSNNSKIWSFSPDSNKAITTIASLGEPDSDLKIYNRNSDKTEETLGFCGTTCGWLNAFWLNNEEFIAIYQLVEQDKPYDTVKFFYRFEVYNLSKNIVSYYSFPNFFESSLINPWRKSQCEKVWGEGNSYCQ